MQGLRIIKNILDLQGRKRFKRVQTAEAAGSGAEDFNKAKQLYHRRNNRAHYNWQFGERPRASNDHQLNGESMALLISAVCKRTAAEYISHFIKINEVEEFKWAVYSTLRDINTVLRNQMATVTSTKQHFTPQKQYEGSAPPRFDKMERELRDRQRAQSCSANNNAVRRMAEQQRRHESAMGFRMPKFDPLMDPKATKQDFLRGNKDAVYYLSASSNQSSYLNTFKGLQVPEDNRAEIIQRFYTTCAGMALPDPAVVSKCPLPPPARSRSRFNCYFWQTKTRGASRGTART